MTGNRRLGTCIVLLHRAVSCREEAAVGYDPVTWLCGHHHLSHRAEGLPHGSSVQARGECHSSELYSIVHDVSSASCGLNSWTLVLTCGPAPLDPVQVVLLPGSLMLSCAPAIHSLCSCFAWQPCCHIVALATKTPAMVAHSLPQHSPACALKPLARRASAWHPAACCGAL